MPTGAENFGLALRQARRTARMLRDAARNTLDKPLHPERHRRACRRLGETRTAGVLFVCSGNICRSPYAERVWKTLGTNVAVESAGFIGPDRAPPAEALRAAAESGIVHADHRSKLLRRDMVSSADAIFAFDGRLVTRVRREYPQDARKVYWLGDFDPVWSGERPISDPWGKDLGEFRKIFLRIERCVIAAARVAGERTFTSGLRGRLDSERAFAQRAPRSQGPHMA
jgi:protein-tyrosine phosphatase